MLSPLISISSATAVIPSAVGWWHRGPADLGIEGADVVATPAAARPTLVAVPAGGLYVENDASGPRAISTLQIPGDTPPTVLTLRVAGQPLLPFGAHLVACPVTSSWHAETNGSWHERPQFNCEASLDGSFTDDRSSVRFDLGANDEFRTPRGIEIGILPAANETVSFAIAFAPPGDVSLDSGTSSAPATAATAQPGTQSPGAAATGSATATPTARSPQPSSFQPTIPAATRVATPLGAISRIVTDGGIRAGLTLAIAVLAGSLWLFSGRQNAPPEASDLEVAA